MLIRLSLKLGHVGLTPRLLGQIIEKTCVHSRGHSCYPKVMKLCLNVGFKTKSLGQILEKPFVHSRGHSFDPKFMKFCQNLGQVQNWVMLNQKVDH